MKKIRSFLILLLVFLLTACNNFNPQEEIVINAGQKLEVHYLDVGQADCSLIKLPSGENILVDGGNRDDKDYIESYLKSHNVTHINAVVATHPHEDHIGSLRNVIADFKTDTIFMPEIDADTLVYTNLLYSIEENGVKEIRVKEPKTIEYGQAIFEILGPIKDYEDKNNSSIVFKMTYGETSFLFTGDIEKEAEGDLLLCPQTYLKADVLKVPHHGSKTSSTKEFLNAVDPKIAIVQVGRDNMYNLPSDSVIDRLTERDLELYRNDVDGEIVVYSDGKNINVETSWEGESNQDTKDVYTDKLIKLTKEDSNYVSDKENNLSIIGNKNSLVYHYSNCKSLPGEANRVYLDSKEKAEKEGYKGHAVCVNN